MSEQLGGVDQVAALVDTALSTAYTEANREGQEARSDLYGLSMSSLGKCPRQAAYRLAGTRPTNPELAVAGEQRQALHGVWLHAGLLPHLAAALSSEAVYEKPVTLKIGDDQIDGTADVFDPPNGIVVDLKTMRDSALTRVAASDEARPEHRMQSGGYALALHQAGWRVDWVVWVHVDRTTGEHVLVVEPWTRRFGLEVLETCWRIQRDRRDPDGAARSEFGPGLSVVCDSCPWLARCWGPDAVPGSAGAQRQLAGDQPGAEHAISEYVTAREQESRARDEKRFWREVVDGLPSETHGRWRLVRSRPGREFDSARAKELLAEWGLSEPTRPGSPRLYVKPAKHD